jgi:hypothetical protein
MHALRDHFGSPCPRCAKDILQPAPSTNRMPGQDLAWCPTCHATLSADDLARRRAPKRGSFLSRLFTRPHAR